MDITVTKTAAHPDRGSWGLRVALDGDLSGWYLRQDLGTPVSVLHTRFACRLSGLDGGEVTLAGASDSEGVAVWWLDYEPVTGALRLAAGGASELVSIDTTDWVLVEVACDVGQGKLTVWVDGQPAATLSVVLRDVATGWLGLVSPAWDATGHIEFDEWVLADGYVGPVRRAMSWVHADEPERWLVLFDRASVDSRQWAVGYADRRGVPRGRLLGLEGVGSEVIDGSTWAAVVQQVSSYLALNDPAGEVMGILVGFGFAGYVQLDGESAVVPVSSLLQVLRADALLEVNADLGTDTRPMAGAGRTQFLTARLDAPSRAEADAWLDRADVLMSEGVLPSEARGLLVQRDMGSDSAAAALRDWLDAEGWRDTRLPMVEVEESAESIDLNGAGLAWLHSTATAAATGGGGVSGFLFQSGDGLLTTSLRDALGTDWGSRARLSGYAGFAGASGSTSFEAWPRVAWFIEALVRGWTLSEAWHVSRPVLRDRVELVGDPLLRIGLPRSGYDVFGPGASWVEALGTRKLSEDELSSSLLANTGWYAVRRVDAVGRHGPVGRPVYVAAGEDVTAARLAEPVWPRDAGWRPGTRDGGLWVPMVWPSKVAARGVEKVELVREREGLGEAVVGQLTMDARGPVDGLGVAWVEGVQRFAWRVYREGRLEWASAWSAWLSPESADEALPSLVGGVV